jgi:cytochrome P450
MKQIYNTTETFIKAPFYLNLVVGLESVFSTPNVEFHRRHRRLLSRPLAESSLKTMEPYIRSLVDLSMERMKQEMAVRGAVDVFKWFMFTTTDVIGELTFGESFRMLDLGKVSNYLEASPRGIESQLISIYGTRKPSISWTLNSYLGYRPSARHSRS